MNYSEMPELPPIEAYEVLTDAQTALDEDEQDAAAAPEFSAAVSSAWRISAASDWSEADIPRREWIVPQYVMRRKVTALIGAPEAGKSGVALRWAISLALNLPFGDFAPVPLPGEAPRPRRVVILNAEDDEEEQRRRISSMIRDTGRRVSDLGDRLVRVGAGKETASLFTLGPDGAIYATPAWEELSEYLKDQRADVLILDPLVELMGGADENSNGIMGQVFAKLRSLAEELGLAIIVIHHTKKGVAVPGNLEAARGGSALGGSIRIGLTLTVMTEAEAEQLGVPKDKRRHYVRLDNAKQSYGPPADGATWLHRFSVHLDNGDTAPALEPWTPPKAREMSLDELLPIAEAIKAGAPDGQPFSPKLSGDVRSVKHALEAQGITGKVSQDATLVALRQRCGMIEADYQRRNEKLQKRGTGRGLRIDGLPEAEWVGSPGATGSSTSGSDDDEN
ncbi:AAA family ATPase [Acidisoma sp. 7E03]